MPHIVVEYVSVLRAFVENSVQEAFVGTDIAVTGLGFTVNGPNGLDVTATPSVNYFSFESSNEEVAVVSVDGIISVGYGGENKYKFGERFEVAIIAGTLESGDTLKLELLILPKRVYFQYSTLVVGN